MTSSDAFMSPPSRARRRIAQAAASSSPDLPSVHDILSQKLRRPPLKGGRNAASTTSTRGGSPLRTRQESKQTLIVKSPDLASLEEIDTSASVIEIRTEDAPPKRKPRRQKRAAPKRGEPSLEAPTGPDPFTDNQPWKKYKSPKKTTGTTADACARSPNCPATGPIHGKNPAEARSRYFKSPQIKGPESDKTSREQGEEPLNLEAATARRGEWTPPSNKVQIIIDSGETPTAGNINSSQRDDETSEPFGNLLASFKCSKPQQPETSSVSINDNPGVLRKRKLLELVSTSLADPSKASEPNQSPTRHKAPKKAKTRTITEIATAAYQPQIQSGSAAASEPPATTAAKPATTAVGKGKQRKRPAKASKKKEPPPKPILLSPNAAMNQVARQDFVFGTSSQLAREQSPTFLRNLQAAMRASNRLESAAAVTPLNSDALEPPEERRRLWGAGARDEDGDLFDVEVRDFADGSGIPEPATEADPFGYVRCAQEDALSFPEMRADDTAQDDGSFFDLSNMLPRPKQSEALEIVDIVSDKVLPACKAEAQQTEAPAKDKKKAANARGVEDSTEDVDCSERRPTTADRPAPDPSLELCTDAQLAKQVAQYGFKPIKKRTAMIALLAQCKQERAASAFATNIGASRSASSTTGTASKEKRPRGRPKKGSVGDAESSEQPPPSAQPPQEVSEVPQVTRKRAGRPKKNAASSGSKSSGEPSGDEGAEKVRKKTKPARKGTAASASEKVAGDKTAKAPKGKRGRSKNDDGLSNSKAAISSLEGDSPAPATPKRKATASTSNPVIEIADSQTDASEDSSEDSSASRSPCPSATFSPAAEAVDLSLIVDEETEAALTRSPTEQRRGLMAHITEAVTTAPRTRDPARPSWHEKMLMYDAIVLEELTAWLNSGQLTRVGWDEEASAAEVKLWCESKSVLCLWEKTARGTERRRG